jgi:hypothetical protein
MSADTLKILLLAHDLSDAAIHRRAVMLRTGGASVTIAGFRRTSESIASAAGCSAIDFGRTYNENFIHRIGSVLRAIILLNRHRALFANADVILARNLEMLAIGVRGRALCRPTPVLVYESLDIHRLLLRRDIIGAALRRLEGWLARRASALITSSPAFVSGYFDRLSKVRLPIRLIENKVLDTGKNIAANPDLSTRPQGPPWIIGWFGMIRCKKSLQILIELVRQGKGMVEVVIRGRPDLNQFDDFHKSVANVPGLRFFGPYKNPDELATIYRDIHFSWTIDMFEEGLNSSWLLPNRLYEGGLYGAVPIAIGSVESGHFLKRLGIGVTIEPPLGLALTDFFRGLTPERYHTLEDESAQIPRSSWVCTKDDCKAFVDYLRSLRGSTNG